MARTLKGLSILFSLIALAACHQGKDSDTSTLPPVLEQKSQVDFKAGIEGGFNDNGTLLSLDNDRLTHAPLNTAPEVMEHSYIFDTFNDLSYRRIFLSSDKKFSAAVREGEESLWLHELQSEPATLVKSFFLTLDGLIPQNLYSPSVEKLTFRSKPDRAFTTRKGEASARKGDFIFLLADSSERAASGTYLVTLDIRTPTEPAVSVLKFLERDAFSPRAMFLSNDSNKLYLTSNNTEFLTFDISNPLKASLIEERTCFDCYSLSSDASPSALRAFDQYLVGVSTNKIVVYDLKNLEKPLKEVIFDQNEKTYWQDKWVAFASDKIFIANQYGSTIAVWSIKDVLNPTLFGQTTLDHDSKTFISGLAAIEPSTLGVLTTDNKLTVFQVKEAP